MGCHWILGSATSCSRWLLFEQWLLHFYCVKTCGSTLYSKPFGTLRYILAVFTLHYHKLLVLFRPYLIQYRKCSTIALVWIFSRFLTDGCLGCRATGSSHMAVTNVDELWHLVAWTIVLVHAIQSNVRLNAHAYNSCYCCRWWLF